MIRRAIIVIVLAVGIGCGLLLPDVSELSSDPEDGGADAATDNATAIDARADAAGGDDAATDDDASDGALSCQAQEAGALCDADGAVCFSDASCGACLSSVTASCQASGECCNGACEPFTEETTIGTCSGICARLGASCLNQGCCLPYTCTAAGTQSICVR